MILFEIHGHLQNLHKCMQWNIFLYIFHQLELCKYYANNIAKKYIVHIFEYI